MRVDRKYYRHVMFKDCTIAALSNDGLIYVFDKVDIVHHLNRICESDKKGWFFNQSKDRYCAEKNDLDDTVIVNPSMVVTIFGFPTLFEEKKNEIKK